MTVVKVGDRVRDSRTGREAAIERAFVQPASGSHPAVDVVEWFDGTSRYRYAAHALLDGLTGWSLIPPNPGALA